MMFESSIFASFIPQILMLVSYLSCLVIPGLQKIEQKYDTTPKQIEITQSVLPIQTSTYIYGADIQYAEPKSEAETITTNLIFIAPSVFPDYPHSLTDCSTFQLFSRPPPTFC